MEIKLLEQYIETYYEKITADNAQQAIEKFDENWEKFVDNLDDDKYGHALVILSVAYHDLPTTTEKYLNHLSELINKYDKNEIVKYKFNIKQVLFHNLGLCWNKLGYDDRAIEAFKKENYYLIIPSSQTSYCPTAFAFRECTTFLYQALINEQLNLSSPTTFNDPFDCPIKELLNGDDISTLQLQAYKECLKIVCFTSNVKLPYNKDPNNLLSEPIYNEKKNRKDKEEFLNELMWAHYANSHKGICIKYRFCDPISQLGGENKNVVAFFKDVKYSNKAMSEYSKKDSINLEDAFFLKGKKWEYENELRFLYYDLNNQSDYGTIEIPNSIEAIYFGLKCSSKDKEAILNIMRTKEFMQKDINGLIRANSPIKFYQMEFDYKHFGQLKAVRMK